MTPDAARSTPWGEWLADQAAARAAAGLERGLRPRPADDVTIDLAGNDYLGLARDPRVTAAAAEAALQWGAGAGASRLVTGTLDLHTSLEDALADYLGQPAALCFSTGYHANLGLVAALADREALVVSDAHIHASLIDAVRLSRAELVVVPHNDVEAVRRAVAAGVAPEGEVRATRPAHAHRLPERRPRRHAQVQLRVQALLLRPVRHPGTGAKAGRPRSAVVVPAVSTEHHLRG